ncbi:hypothetical protein L596_010935 [Steinernema carpocapsae]|uniref:Uncharacterized protein n=1 Tax=Steinernema carpocapsae TaxID=34508 RepID=A0A4U5PMS3_STECR|nr:hypothetical protein L596_010935 [Steinernema carpocapsae]
MVAIKPVKGSDEWLVAINFILGHDKDNIIKVRHLHDINDYPEDSPLGMLHLRSDNGVEEWFTVSGTFAKEELMPFIIRKLEKKAYISFHGYTLPFYRFRNSSWYHPDEVQKMAEIVFEALNGSKCTFETMEMAYYGPFCDTFVSTQIENGLLESLNLYGPWPNGAISFIKKYVERYDKPRINLHEENCVEVSRELFEMLFKKFLNRKLYLKDMYGTLNFEAVYLRTWRTDLHVTNEIYEDEKLNYLMWKSPVDCRDFFVVLFETNDKVQIYTKNTGLCLCRKKHKLFNFET